MQQISDLKDEVTDYDVEDLNPIVNALRVEQGFNRSYDYEISIISNSIPKFPDLQETRKREKPTTKSITAELIIFAAQLFNELKDRLPDVRETGSVSNSSSIILQNPRTKCKSKLQLSRSEHAELRKLTYGIYNNIFKVSSDLKASSAIITDKAYSSERDVRTSFSPLHTRVEDKINRKSLATSTRNWDALDTSIAENNAQNFSGTKMNGDVEDKKMMAYMESTGDDSIFHITKDNEEGTIIDGGMGNAKAKRPESKRIICKQLKILQLEKDLQTVNELQKKFVKLGTTVRSQNYSNRFFEKVVRSDVIERDNKSAGDDLDILSNSTDKKCSDFVKVKDGDAMEPKLLNFTKSRRSLAVRGKELLNKIAKARAALQTSMLSLDDSDSLESDKTLHCDNESISEESFKEHPTLKLTPFGETSYMRVPKETTVPKLATRLTNSQANFVDSNPVSNHTTSSENLKETDDFDSMSMYLHTHVYEPLMSNMSKVLVFDRLNPLNNILLRPNNITEVHKYNPMKPEKKLWNPEHNRNNNKNYNQACRLGTTRDFEVGTMTIQQHRFVPRSAQEANQRIEYSRSYSIDAEEQTVETDSSKLSEYSVKTKFSSNKSSIVAQTKKQIRGPITDKDNHHGSVDVTPKLQKKSFLKRKKILTSKDKTMCSPAPTNHEKLSNQNSHISKIRDKKSRQTKMTGPGQNITVRQFIADCIGFDTSIEHNNDYKEKLIDGNFNVNAKSQNATSYSQSDMSFSSSKNLNPMKDFLSPPYEGCLPLHQPTIQSIPFQEDWQPKPPASKVLVFDYLNSLNNVLIYPFNAAKAQKSDPMKSDKMLYCFKHSSSNEKCYNQTPRDFDMRTETCNQHLADPQVSVTGKENPRMRLSKLWSADIEKQATDMSDTINKLSNISLYDHFSSNSHRKVTKNKKGTYIPSKGKHRHMCFAQVTPKPIIKRQKISTSTQVKFKVRLKSPTTVDASYKLGPHKNKKEAAKKILTHRKPVIRGLQKLPRRNQSEV